MVIINTMPVLASLAILLTYSCSTSIMMPWVQQWRSDAFSPVLECQLILQKNRQILLTGCWHNTTQKDQTKTTSASLFCINLPKKHVRCKPQPIYHLTMPIKQTNSVCCPDAQRGFIFKGDSTGLTLNNKGDDVRTSAPLPASSSGSVVATVLLALADSSNSNKDIYRPIIHAPPGPRTNCFSKKAPTKTKIAAECKAVKEVKQKEAKDKKAATATRKADGLAKRQEKMISSAKAKASTTAAKAESLCSKLADVMKAAAVPEAAHLPKKSKGMLRNVPTNPSPVHMLSLSPQRKSMSAKKRVSMQSPLRPSYNKEDKLSLDDLVMSVSSRSSGTSLTTTVKKYHGTLLTPTALRHVPQGRGTPAQGHGGRRYSIPLGRGQGRQTEGRATLADCGHQAVGGGVKKYHGEPCNPEVLAFFYLRGGPLSNHETDSTDSMDGSLFGSESHPPNNVLAHSSLKGNSSANGPIGAREEELSDNPNEKGSVGLTDDDSSVLVLSPPRVSGSG
jgi:hypothetical protein